MKDTLGDRMKKFYEHRTRYLLPRRTWTIIRIDGKAFHSYTRGLKRPFDDQLMSDLDETAKFLCKEISGTKLAFIQSDEISIVLTDFNELKTEAWFDGGIQKMASVSASLATGKFNELRPGKVAFFDSRVFTIPYQTEVENYLIWRQQDATRNSISSVAQSFYSHKELMGKSCDQMQELIFQKGTNWNDFASRYKRGRLVVKTMNENNRPRWSVVEIPVFTQDKEFLKKFLTITE